MTIWGVMKAYLENDREFYYVMPYDLCGTVKTLIRMNCSLKGKLRILRHYRLTKRAAESTAKRWNTGLALKRGMQQAQSGESVSVEDAFADIRARHKD